tara:strand:- start:214 stop:1080 length:867 start_codon:yes stop_codon:yes gene_type:complete
MSMKRILLTGANGFVGNYFLKKYSSSYEIITFSFLNDNFVNLDLSNIDVVIHCSALVHQMKGASWEQYEKININQTIQLADKAKKSGVKHFIFLSTIKVYGEESNKHYYENSRTNPTDYYSISKLKAEDSIRNIESSNFKISVLRCPLIYGAGVRANFANLINLIKKAPILPFKNIKNKRSLVFVGNVCFILHRIIFLEKRGIFLSVDDKALSTTDLIQMIAKYLDKKILLIDIIFFDKFLKIIKPSYYQRLFGSLVINNDYTMETLKLEKNKYSTAYGIREIFELNI